MVNNKLIIGMVHFPPLPGSPEFNDDKDLSKHFSVQETQEKFTKVKTCLFLPNSVFIFPRATNSFHGVEEVNIEQKERNLLLLNYYLGKKLK